MKNIISPITIISILVAILLVIGCFRLPIGYYTFLRIAVSIAAIILLANSIKEKRNWQAIAMGLIAILFNPIIPIYLHSKAVWMIIDVFTAVCFLTQPLFLCTKCEKGISKRGGKA